MHERVMTAPADRKSVLITGASSGVGEACAVRLATRHWRVFAGVRNDADASRLRAFGIADLIPVWMDVTQEDSLRQALAVVTSHCGQIGLDALVNNAGIGRVGPQEVMPLEMWRQVFEVNLFGVVATTRTFLPLLRQATGQQTTGPRILNIGSAFGLISIPFVAPYCASKHALEAITSSLRVELLPEGIHVAIIDPGHVRTRIWEKADMQFQEMIQYVQTTGHSEYFEPLKVIAEQGIAEGRAGITPDRVARVVEQALTATRPRTGYLVGKDAWFMAWARRLLPRRTAEFLIRHHLGLNHRHGAARRPKSR